MPVKCIFLHAKVYILAAQNIYFGSFDPTLRVRRLTGSLSDLEPIKVRVRRLTGSVSELEPIGVRVGRLTGSVSELEPRGLP